MKINKFAKYVAFSFTLLISNFAIAEPDLNIAQSIYNANYEKHKNTPELSANDFVYHVTDLNMQSGDIGFGDTFIRAKFKYLNPVILKSDIVVNYKFGGKVIEVQSGSQGYFAGNFEQSSMFGNKKLESNKSFSNNADLYCFFGTKTKENIGKICFFEYSDGILGAPNIANPYFITTIAGTPVQQNFENFIYERINQNQAVEHTIEYRLKSKSFFTWSYDILIDGQIVTTESIVRKKDEISDFATPIGVFTIVSGSKDKTLQCKLQD